MLEWPGNINVAPDVLYSKATGLLLPAWMEAPEKTEKPFESGLERAIKEGPLIPGKQGLASGLGYKPLDPRLPNLEKFYARCEAEGIPILTHCSPGGMTTHEAKFYHAYDKADLSNGPTRIVSCTYDPCTPLGYFFDEYVHPKNWRPVLMKYPKLKLCLAHFGGREWNSDEDEHGFPGSGLASDWVKEITNLCDPQIVQGHGAKGEIKFKNVYTDLSCYDLAKSSIKVSIR